MLKNIRVNIRKYKFLFISIFVLLSFIIVITVFLYRQINIPYTKIIDMNWSIKLPDSYKKIYSIDSGASFQGDGERYHIFQYTNENDIKQSVNWESNKNKSFEAEVDKVLSKLNVPKEHMPEFQNNYKYYTLSKQDSSKIYLVFISDTEKLYVIEDIY